MNSRSTFLALLFGLGVALSATSGLAQSEGETAELPPSRGVADVSPEIAAKAASIARQTMSPFCPGRTLDDCPSEYASEWRRDIRSMVAKGMTAAQIQDELERRVGGNLSGIPNRESSYALPIVLATGAALVLYLVFVRLRRRDEAEEADKSKKTTKRSKKKSVEKSAPNASTVDDERLKRELADED